ncbi:MAG: dTDP-4-dehydrorhamnose reductase [Paraglaciecola sp.]|uniref:dTDP-4-dehydrorhamnose reductase n=1 Tax=Paraglaciecola sp. TaxID=1920173 RepID=UPI003265B9C4
MTTIVIGKSGQLAQELSLLSDELVCLGRDDIDILDIENITNVLSLYSPTSLINASAYTAVDKAESDEKAAYALNHIAVQNLAQYCLHNNIHMVHISTDYVFSGDKGFPYKIDDTYAPIGVYGASKMCGEQELLRTNAEGSCIIRTSWVYSQFGNNFVKTMLRLMAEKTALGVIDDQIGSPTSAKALAAACLFAADNKVQGVHHFTDAGVASWYDFAVAIQKIAIEKSLLKKSIVINPIPTIAYPTPAKRPTYSVLDKNTLNSSFNHLQPKHWQSELADVIELLKSNLK